MAAPRASCLMPVSKGRRDMARMVLACWETQTAASELLIADFHGELADVELPVGARLVPVSAGDHGTQLRALVAAAAGEICVRFDDDDWYGPRRVESAVAVLEARPEPAAALVKSPYVDLRTGELLESTQLWPGHGYAFRRSAFEALCPEGTDAFVYRGEVAPIGGNEQGELCYATVHGGCSVMDRTYPFRPWTDGKAPRLPLALRLQVGGGFCLPSGYRSRWPVEAWEPRYPWITYQPDVYTDAVELAQALQAPGILDLGCGDGDKLAALQGTGLMYLGVGTDVTAARKRWPRLTFRRAELEQGFRDEDAREWVAVCADVLEHLQRPDRLLRDLRAHKAVILTTPDRALMQGASLEGPPVNLCHVREWTGGEFMQLVDGYLGRTHTLTVATVRSNDQTHARHTTQVVALRR